MAASKKRSSNAPTIENRKARHKFVVEETLECGIRLTGTEVKSIRNGQMSLGEGYVRAANGEKPSLTLHGVHISEYPPAGEKNQHEPTRVRALLAHRREIRKLVEGTRTKGYTLIPLKVYFVRGRAKVLIGLARGRRKQDKREDMAKQESRREINRAMSQRR